jgi:hypothetical protein
MSSLNLRVSSLMADAILRPARQSIGGGLLFDMRTLNRVSARYQLVTRLDMDPPTGAAGTLQPAALQVFNKITN